MQGGKGQPAEQRLIFLVEDDPMQGRVYERELRYRSRYIVRTFTGPKAAALAVAAIVSADRFPDLVLTDLSMPEHDGLWLLKRLGELDRLVATIVLTSYYSPEHMADAYALGARGFWNKDGKLREKVDGFFDDVERLPCVDQGYRHRTLEEVAREHVERVYESMGRNVTKTAAALGIDRHTVTRILKR